eukprot:evm.model.NODE_41771_length_14365_cov_26.770136.2
MQLLVLVGSLREEEEDTQASQGGCAHFLLRVEQELEGRVEAGGEVTKGGVGMGENEFP